MVARGGEPGVAAAPAEADREHGLGAALTQVRDTRRDVGLHVRRRRLLDMRHVLEVVAAFLDAGRPPEVVEREPGVPALREPQRQFFVEPVEAADIGQDHDADRARVIRSREECGEPVPVGSLEKEVVVRNGRPRYRRDRRCGVEVEAHGGPTLAQRLAPRLDVCGGHRKE